MVGAGEIVFLLFLLYFIVSVFFIIPVMGAGEIVFYCFVFILLFRFFLLLYQ